MTFGQRLAWAFIGMLSRNFRLHTGRNWLSALGPSWLAAAMWQANDYTKVLHDTQALGPEMVVTVQHPRVLIVKHCIHNMVLPAMVAVAAVATAAAVTTAAASPSLA